MVLDGHVQAIFSIAFSPNGFGCVFSLFFQKIIHFACLIT
jgi:hypothetical protein